MTARPRSLLNGFALALVALAVFACSSSTDEGEPPNASDALAASAEREEAPAATIGAEPVAGEVRLICGLPAGFGLEVFDEDIDPDAPAISFTGDGGFVPKRLDIEPGAQVRFVNDSGEDFWPASNIHPTHSILPELDANRPIAPGKTWAFTFKSSGFWRFHNHLAPEFGGLVVVLGDDSGPPPKPLAFDIPDVPFETPRNIPSEDYASLLRDGSLLHEYIRRYGPENTVRLLKEAEFHTGEDCHQSAHYLGRAAYEEFGASAFALSSHECQSGSFHGATEALFASRGTVNLEQDVATICAAADNPFFRHQCVHGVGHGLMAWTSYELHDALPLCDRMPTGIDKESCYSGVFMENVVGGLTGLMGHVTQYLSDEDPHFPCDVVDKRYQSPCYFYQTSHMLKVFDRDFSKIARACAEAPPETHWHCFQSYGRDVGNATRKDPATAIRYCSYVPAGTNRVGCIMGAVQDRFWEKSGTDDALTMCAMVEDAAEQDGCYGTIIVRARDVLTTREESEGFCARVGPRWRDWCFDELLAEKGSLGGDAPEGS
ncbi:MAG: hypothetical protein OXI57_12270 [Rhodospirillales bacterium]|nr:hypothetical protein [Rhodospirillales bacterium]